MKEYDVPATNGPAFSAVSNTTLLATTTRVCVGALLMVQDVAVPLAVNQAVYVTTHAW